MSLYEYLPHEYSYSLSLADHYNIYSWDSMIHNNNLNITDISSINGRHHKSVSNHTRLSSYKFYLKVKI